MSVSPSAAPGVLAAAVARGLPAMWSARALAQPPGPGRAGRLADAGGGGGTAPGLRAESGAPGLTPTESGPPALGAPTPGGTFAVGPPGPPGVARAPCGPAAPGAVAAEGAVPGWAGGTPGLASGPAPAGPPVAALGGGGGAPFVPGTGNVLALGNAWPGGGAVGATVAGSGAFAAAPPLAPGGPLGVG